MANSVRESDSGLVERIDFLGNRMNAGTPHTEIEYLSDWANQQDLGKIETTTFIYEHPEEIRDSARKELLGIYSTTNERLIKDRINGQLGRTWFQTEHPVASTIAKTSLGLTAFGVFAAGFYYILSPVVDYLTSLVTGHNPSGK